MYRTATMAAYDVMDQVFVTAQVRTYEPNGEGFDSVEFVTATTIPSEGEDVTREWLRDALIALAETL